MTIITHHLCNTEVVDCAVKITPLNFKFNLTNLIETAESCIHYSEHNYHYLKPILFGTVQTRRDMKEQFGQSGEFR